jgi:urease accessory protein
MVSERQRKKAGGGSGRLVVRDAGLRPVPHHEADRTHGAGSLILRSRAKRGISKDEGRSADDRRGQAALYRLMAWLSPSYPVGAFSYSSGLEWAVEAGDVTDAETLRRWLAVMIRQGGGFCDAVFLTHAHRAASAGDEPGLRAVAELAAAFAPSQERHLETIAQGGAFLAATRAAWPCAALDRLAAIWDGPIAYPVAVGVAAAGHAIPVAQTVAAYVQALAASLVLAGVRLVPLGQSDGQRVIAELEEAVAATAGRAQSTPLDEVGGAAFRADLAGMRHETQYTRLFRS